MLKTVLNGVTMKNPVIAASGTFGFGREYDQFFDISRLGGISSKGLTLEERFGNEGERVYETPSGLINSIGLQNPGVDAFIREDLPFLRQKDTAVIANLGGSTIESYLEGVEKLNETDVDMIELNISCPNVKHGGMALGIKCDIAYEAVKQVRAVCKKPLMVKLSPNAENIVEMALRCEEAGADSLSLVNTFQAMAIDIYKRKPVFNNVFAGLSGPAVFPIALRMVYQVCGAVKIPVVGLGGIASWQDAAAFLMAGATAVQVGTANFVKPDICLDIIQGLEQFLKEQGCRSVSEIIGAARV
ncbi:MAG: dihydroorotate dehydrogenase [Oscillospiraceae bacterium]|nr:dihydroorotate dehydrogenase [Oscillospiraceae bacterium]MDD5920395.1 dihydroorotate dehydrogenase [Oscillospiraceae bacterium]HAG56672.1 dihydroorotate dehydrogenase [Oscillospiraceae bacterium]HAO68561.1 dihydroorotate dehydrogenase [Oscillospiraceae bacterium]HCU32255.1 dihydroorotate dehydrogenase [Oscillospiraceae bacterium]